MMGLDPTGKEEVFLDVEDEYTQKRVPTALSRQDLRAAISDIDDWVDDNLSSYVAAIPEPTRSATTAKQKVRLLLHVINKRWEVE